jgi:hypothetical protein
MALNDLGAEGDIARALAGIGGKRDAQGNILAGECSIGPGVVVRDSVLLDARIAEGEVRGSVLVGTRARAVKAREAFDVLSTVAELILEPRSGTYKVVSTEGLHARAGERLTTLFLPGRRLLFRVLEGTDLRDRASSYDRPILGNPLSFREAHQAMSVLGPEELALRREAAEREVLGLIGP